MTIFIVIMIIVAIIVFIKTLFNSNSKQTVTSTNHLISKDIVESKPYKNNSDTSPKPNFVEYEPYEEDFLNMPPKYDFVKENAHNIDVIREHIVKELYKHNILHNVRNSDQNISIKKSERDARAFIDFKVECNEYGHPVARLRDSGPFYDSRIVHYSSDGNCTYPKRHRKLENEKFNIGITDDSALELTIKVLKSIL